MTHSNGGRRAVVDAAALEMLAFNYVPLPLCQEFRVLNNFSGNYVLYMIDDR